MSYSVVLFKKFTFTVHVNREINLTLWVYRSMWLIYYVYTNANFWNNNVRIFRINARIKRLEPSNNFIKVSRDFMSQRSNCYNVNILKLMLLIFYYLSLQFFKGFCFCLFFYLKRNLVNAIILSIEKSIVIFNKTFVQCLEKIMLYS